MGRFVVAGFLSLVLAAVSPAAYSLPVTAKSADVQLAQDMSSEELMKRGKRVFLMCRSCHTLDEAGRHKVGPNLWGVFGSAAGGKDGFRYSVVVKESGIVWSAETIEEWLVKPRGFLPGNKMAFRGVRKPEDRNALIAYLKRETGAAQ